MQTNMPDRTFFVVAISEASTQGGTLHFITLISAADSVPALCDAN
jgi:hypothetical protein